MSRRSRSASSRPGGKRPSAPIESAALAWCELRTEVAGAGAVDPEHDAPEAVFSPEEIGALTVAVVAINSWNRVALGHGTDVTSLGGIDFPPPNDTANPTAT